MTTSKIPPGWYVITAGPSAGKSTTINALSAQGYRTAPEAARLVIEQAISEGGSAEQIRKRDDFQGMVESKDLRIEDNLPDDEVVFLDRSLADNIAYRRHRGNEPPEIMTWLRGTCEDRYEKVFLLDRIDFQDDDVRTEDEMEAQRIHHALRDTYEDLGYDVVEVPVEPVDNRVARIIMGTIPTIPSF